MSDLLSERADGIPAFGAAEAQPAVAHFGDFPPCDRHARRNTRQQQIKNSRLCIHHAARQAHDRLPVWIITQQEHRPRQNRRAVGDDVRTAFFDCTRRIVVGIDAHAAGAENHVCLFRAHFRNCRSNLLKTVNVS